jgi:glycosyltransferase involved in cell wall biosynthesis
MMRITVCACTFRRPAGLRALLDGLARQELPLDAGVAVDFAIVDNEGSEAARAACDAFRSRCGRPTTYVVEPRRGIAFARNSCLDQVPVTSSFFAMLDDDEVPAPDWLAELVRAQRATGADVVQGAVVPRLPDDTPAWIRDGRFFGWPPDPFARTSPPADLSELRSAATNNVLVRCEPVRTLGLRFEPELALRGGEDALFFRTLRRAGARLVYAARARVDEIVPPERARLAYLARLQYRQGHKPLGLKLLSSRCDAGPVARLRLRGRIALRGLGTLFEAGARSAVVALAGRGREALTLELLRACRGAGLVASAAGGSYEPYR